MIDKFFSSFSERNQGNILIITGVFLLLNSLGLVSLNFVLAIIAIGMIWYGCTKAHYTHVIKSWINKEKK
jgi:predicted membrane protein